MDRLIAEDLLLLLLDDEKGTSTSAVDLTTAMGGAVLIELALDGQVTVQEATSRWRSAKVRVEPAASETDPLLRHALEVVAEKERSAPDLVGRLGQGVRDQLTERLAADGVLERRDGKVLGLFNRTTWPTANASHEADVRRALTRVLVEGVDPDPRTAALVSMLYAVGQAHRVVPHQGVSARDVRRRAKEIAEGAWAAKAVQDAIAAATTVVMAAVMVTTTAASAGS